MPIHPAAAIFVVGIISLHLASCALPKATARPGNAADGMCSSDRNMNLLPPDIKILVLGELHGTVESPAATQAFLCQILRSREVILALEMPKSALDPIFPHSSPSADTKHGIETRIGASDDSFWNRPANYQDGKSSEATLDLLWFVRELNDSKTRKHVSVVAIDPNKSPDRSAAINRNIGLLSAEGQEKVIVALIGNLHARKFKSVVGDAIKSGGDGNTTLILKMASGGGTAWVCELDGCGAKSWGASQVQESKTQSPTWALTPGDDGFDGYYWLPKISAAAPLCVRLRSCK